MVHVSEDNLLRKHSNAVHGCRYLHVILYCMFILLQHIDEQSEGLVWASGEGCLEDVVFLLCTGVEVNSEGQVRVGK